MEAFVDSVQQNVCRVGEDDAALARIAVHNGTRTTARVAVNHPPLAGGYLWQQ
jgi:hypothetical protein